MTLRQLLLMAEGHSRDRWSRLASLLAMLANCNRDPKKGRAFKPTDFDPHARADRTDVIEVDSETIGMFRQAFQNS